MADDPTLDLGAEGQAFDRKSLRAVAGATADLAAIAADCVAFANAAGGRLYLGLEDGEDLPPAPQRVDSALVDRVRKRIGELTVNVTAHPELRTAPNGGQYLVLHVQRAYGVASTTDGRFFLRVADSSRPMVGDEVLRLATDRPQTPWETLTGLGVPQADADPAAIRALTAALRASPRVKSSVTQKSDPELLLHYGLVDGRHLTHLGALLVGQPSHRVRLGTAPVLQVIRYDERGVKVAKLAWDDHHLTPVALIDEVWRTVPDFRERYEIPEGLFRATVPAYDEVVVRELLVNALVHRPYTQRGDLFVNLHPDRMEIVNPGRLPLGVTPQNILHVTRRRNDGLARVFHDLGLMEREGSGFDTLYERLLTTGRRAPTVQEGTDFVRIVVPRRVLHPGVVKLIAQADQHHQLTQRERITLGLLAQTEGLPAKALVDQLSLNDVTDLRPWLGRLLELGLLHKAGRTRSTHYFVPPELLRASDLDQRTTLARIEPHRLHALILEDLRRYPDSTRPDIHRRVAPELSESQIRRELKAMVDAGDVVPKGERRWRVYHLPAHEQHGGGDQ